MPARNGQRARGRERATRITHELAVAWRDLRLAAGLSQANVALAAGISRSTLSRIERRRACSVQLAVAAALSAVLGGNLSVKVYPADPPVRDAAHIALLARLDSSISPRWRVTNEAPMPISGDLRAWDRRLDGPASIGIEAETRLHDVQALERAMQLKLRDSRVDRMILVVGATHGNRTMLRAVLPQLRAPLSTLEVLRALRAGRDPGANGIAFV
jgi:transcriptional regulator with XRE-family HTH domain